MVSSEPFVNYTPTNTSLSETIWQQTGLMPLFWIILFGLLILLVVGIIFRKSIIGKLILLLIILPIGSYLAVIIFMLPIMFIYHDPIMFEYNSEYMIGTVIIIILVDLYIIYRAFRKNHSKNQLPNSQ